MEQVNLNWKIWKNPGRRARHTPCRRVELHALKVSVQSRRNEGGGTASADLDKQEPHTDGSIMRDERSTEDLAVNGTIRSC